MGNENSKRNIDNKSSQITNNSEDNRAEVVKMNNIFNTMLKDYKISNKSHETYFDEREIDEFSKSDNFGMLSGKQLKSINAVETKEELGRGAFGVVIKAQCPINNLDMAVKKIPITEASGDTMAKIKNEVFHLQLLRHDNIVSYYGYLRTKNFLKICMEYIKEGSIERYLNNGETLSEKTVAEYTREILKGLRYLHYNAIIHKDIKPDNILGGLYNGIKLADFGSAKRIIDMMKSYKGTLNYTAPEVS